MCWCFRELHVDIVDCVRCAVIDPIGVAVVIEAQHMCMVMRGVSKPSAKTITSTLLGKIQVRI